MILECSHCGHPRGRVCAHLCRFTCSGRATVWRVRQPELVALLAAIELAGQVEPEWRRAESAQGDGVSTGS